MIKDKFDCRQYLKEIADYIRENKEKFKHWKGCLNLVNAAKGKIEEDIECEQMGKM